MRYLSLFGLLCLAGCTEAMAVDVTIDPTVKWAITATSEPAFVNGKGKAVSTFRIINPCVGVGNCYWEPTTLQSWNAVAKKSNGTTMSGWNYVKCWVEYDAKTGVSSDDTWTTYFGFVVADGGWPVASGGNPQWPETVSCYKNGINVDGIAGNDSALATVHLTANPNPNWQTVPTSAITVSSGYTVTLYGTTSTYSEGSKIVKAKLQSGTYVDGTIYAKRPSPNQAQTWTGVTALIEEGGTTDYITYSIDAASVTDPDEGTGSFTISRNGSNVSSPIVVDRQY